MAESSKVQSSAQIKLSSTAMQLLLDDDNFENACEICCEDLQKKKMIQCKNCDYKTCLSCTKKLIFDSALEAYCIKCRKQYTLEFMNASFPKTFIKTEYRNHRKIINYEMFINKMEPVYASFSKEMTHGTKVLDKLRAELSEQYSKFKEIDKYEVPLFCGSNRLSVETYRNNCEQRHRYLTKLNYYADICKDLRLRISVIEKSIKSLCYSIDEKKIDKKSSKSLKRCFTNECPGFLDDTGLCLCCQKRYCYRCHEIKEDDHKCDPDILESVRLIAKECKNCPKCNMAIYKIAGCSQMFCTDCNTPFDFNTGQILSVTFFHNPHFTEFINKGGQIVDAVVYNCRDTRTWMDILHKNEGLRLRFIKSEQEMVNIDAYKTNDPIKCLRIIVRLLNFNNHLRTRDVISKYAVWTQSKIYHKQVKNYLALINGKTTKKNVETMLLRIEDAMNKRREIRQAFNMFAMHCDALSNKIYDTLPSNNEPDNVEYIQRLVKICEEIPVFIKSINEIFQNISQQHRGIVPKIFITDKKEIFDIGTGYDYCGIFKDHSFMPTTNYRF